MLSKKIIRKLFQASNLSDDEKNEKLFEYYLNSRDDNVFRIACVYNNDKFIVFCANNKIKLPQSLLYLYIVSNKIEMCNYCITSGCKIDKYCLSLSLKTLDIDLIKYCMRFGLKPTEEDIYELFFT